MNDGERRGGTPETPMRRPARTPNRARNTPSSSTPRVLFATIVVMFAVVGQRPSRAADTPDALPYSLSYTVTGDYAVGGVDLLPASQTNGFQTATIHMGTSADDTVPANAEILAAFLYWETLANSTDQLAGVEFR